tara:strand:- start:1644 stop:3983 length:2340 start_codon:yes stop_codon:yes gene_type:complete
MKLDIVLIKNKIILIKFILFFVFLTSSYLYASQENGFDDNYCKKSKFNTSVNNLKSIKIEFKNYKKWSENGLRILNIQHKKNFIPQKYKKRFNANIIVYHYDKNICQYGARIRQSGDHFDHIKFKNGNIVQSLDVHLDKGNILGVTKFKLFIPSTRNANSEIIITKLLKDLGYISPKTFLLDSNLNGKKLKFLFQEKASKELVENSLLKDAPLYEGNENLIIGTSKNKEVIFNKKLTFVKQINSNWIRSDLRKNISVEGLTKLNEVYFKNILNFSNKNKKIDQVTLDYKKLSNGDERHFEYLTIYDALINAVNGGHALIPHNRKFYYEPFSRKFFPVFYDASPGSAYRSLLGWRTKIKKLNNDQFKWGLSKNATIGSNMALYKLNQIDNEKFYNDLKDRGISYKKKEYLEVIEAIKANLKVISDVNDNDNNNYEINLKEYLAFVKEDTRDFNIFYSDKSNYFICEKQLGSCSAIILETKNFQNLINGELNYQNKKSLYLGELLHNGENFVFNNFEDRDNKKINTKKIIFNENKIYIKSSNDLNIKLNEKEKSLKIEASSDDWVVIEDSTLKDLNINIEYLENKQKNNSIDRFNKYFLTGCINIINSKMTNLKIDVKNAKCEDAINIVNSKGKISSINIKNSAFDGLDMDFSDIEINKLFVENSGNDCADFSLGTYNVISANLINCGDKGVSVGEKSKASIKKLEVSISEIGVASKDGSKVLIDESLITNTNFCLSAYNKKNEFDGGIINVNSFICENSKNHTDVDNYSKIIIKENINDI